MNDRIFEWQAGLASSEAEFMAEKEAGYTKDDDINLKLEERLTE